MPPQRNKGPRRRDKRRSAEDSLTKEEKAVAYYVRHNCPSKQTMWGGNEVYYFKAADAIETLQKSKWATGARRTSSIFNTRAQIIDYMNELMSKGVFWRAKTLVSRSAAKKKEDEGPEEPETSRNKSEDGTPRKRKNPAKTEKDKDTAAEATEDPDKEEPEKKKPPDDDDKKKKKKKRKVKLEWVEEQVFRETNVGSDVYVWHYDPTSWLSWIIGLAILAGSIAVCLFPLWPPWLRLGVYYLSVLAMVLVGVLIGLIVLRTVVFCSVWLTSLGKHHLWILPNLTEDCGFFESFRPAYDYKYYPSKKDKDEADRKKKAEKEAAEETEETGEEEEEEEEEEGEEEGEEDEEEEEEEEEVSGTGESAPATPVSAKGRKKAKGRQRPKADDGFELLEQPEE